jgi:hypothetical protein
MSRGGQCGKKKCKKKECSNKPSCSQNGKGDAPRNVSSRFKENYDLIDWPSQRKQKKEKS